MTGLSALLIGFIGVLGARLGHAVFRQAGADQHDRYWSVIRDDG